MAERPDLRLLLVDDDPAIARMVQQILVTSGLQPARHVTSGSDALEAAADADIVLLDQQLPDVSGLEVLDALRAQPSPPSVVLITGYGNESFAAAALRRGADDYLAKDASLTELLPQVIERVRRVRELRKALTAAERDLVRAERLAAIGEMTVTLHHEINNPLMAASTEVQLLLADRSLHEAHAASIRTIHEALVRITDIVRRIGGLRDARATSYVSGVQMIDLGQSTAETRTDRGTCALYVPDEDLARITALLLRHAGYRVQRCRTLAELRVTSAALGTTLVVVAGGGTVPGADPLGGFRPAADRTYRTLALVADDGSSARKAGADHVIQVPFDPATFSAEVARLSER